MVLSIEPLVAALESIERLASSQVIAMSPQGQTFNQPMAEDLHAQWQQLILVCGRYEGFDQRFLDHWVDQLVSIGDFVLSGGELAAMVVMETISRLVPGVIGSVENVQQDTFTSGRYKHPQYTKPAVFRGMAVPEVLLSGNHEKIRDWREKQSRKRTLQMRPDLLKEANILSLSKSKKDS
jgi:tRNA (guanine37-N1)-methyltransferase